MNFPPAILVKKGGTTDSRTSSGHWSETLGFCVQTTLADLEGVQGACAPPPYFRLLILYSTLCRKGFALHAHI